jgi:glycosyltransferase involved in cell wall biosynthesis
VTSVLQQSHADFELIVVDDGSTDGSANALDDIADARLTLHRQANAGVGAARTAGMKIAQNNWIALLDADDMWLPNHLAELVRLSRHFPTAGLLSTRMVELPDEQQAELDASADRKCKTIDYFSSAAQIPGLIHSSSAAVHRGVLEKLGGFSNDLTGEDGEYWVRIALEFPVAVSQRRTSIYYRGTNGIMEQIAAREPERRQYATLADVSPALRTLSQTPLDQLAGAQKQSINSYINAEIINTIRDSLYRCEIDAARELSRLSPAPTASLQILRALLTLPRPLVATMAIRYRALRARRRPLSF